MTEKIVTPIAPDVTNPAPLGPLSGNPHDDDAQAYEQDFTHADARPPKDVKGVPHVVDKIKPATRLLTRSVSVGTIGGALVDPIMLLPADPNRHTLQLQAYSAAASTFIIGDSKSDCYNGIVLNGGPGVIIISLGDHTGAVWVYSKDPNSVSVAAVAVTE